MQHPTQHLPDGTGVPVMSLARGEAVGLDALDAGIVGLLQENGRATNQEIAGRLSVTAATVSTRIRRLEDERLLQVIGVSDFAAHGLEVLLAVGVRVAGRAAEDVARDLVAFPEIMSVNVMIGPQDIELLVALRRFDDINAFLGGRLATVPGVHALEAAVAARIVKFGFNVAPLTTEGLEPGLRRLEGGPLDPIDRRIVERLAADGRVSNRQIATELDIAEGTVRARLKRLQGERLLAFTTITDLRIAGNPGLVMLGIDADPVEVQALARELAALDALNCVIILSGRYSLLAMGLFGSIRELHDLVGGRIRRLRGARRVDVAIAVRSLKYETRIASLPGARPPLSPE